MVRSFSYLPDLFVTQLRGVMREDSISEIYVHNSMCSVLYPNNCKTMDELCSEFGVGISHDYTDVNDYEAVSVTDMRLSPTCMW